MPNDTSPVLLHPRLEEILPLIPGWHQEAEIAVRPIPGGITNQNFRVEMDWQSFVVRIPGEDTDVLGIDREAERAAAEAAATAGIAPAVVAFLPSHGALVTRFVDAEAIPEGAMGEEQHLGAVAHVIKTLHGLAAVPSTFDAFRVVEAYRDRAAERGVPIPDDYEVLRETAARLERALPALPSRPCHNDLLRGNFLLEEGRVLLVDYEYAGMGDVFFDLANLSVNNELGHDAQMRLLELYFGKVTPPAAARLALMRIMSDFREAMWGVVQQGISKLDFDYVEYAAKHFARGRANAADERLDAWLEDAQGGV